ncbi:MAG: ABC transporter permease, partial [Candidatus Bipolaricaulia bacterium]
AITGQRVDTAYLTLYLLVGTLVWAYLATVFDGLSEAISWERWEGTIEYTLMAPISRLTHLLGTTAFAIAYGLVRTLLILAVVALFFQIDLG